MTDDQAFYKAFTEMKLRITSVDKVYCLTHNPERPPEEWNVLLHYVWNKYKRKMISLEIDRIDDNIAKTHNNEYLQAVVQGYEFTPIDHIYSKDNKTYTYNK